MNIIDFIYVHCTLYYSGLPFLTHKHLYNLPDGTSITVADSFFEFNDMNRNQNHRYNNIPVL